MNKVWALIPGDSHHRHCEACDITVRSDRIQRHERVPSHEVNLHRHGGFIEESVSEEARGDFNGYHQIANEIAREYPSNEMDWESFQFSPCFEDGNFRPSFISQGEGPDLAFPVDEYPSDTIVNDNDPKVDNDGPSEAQWNQRCGAPSEDSDDSSPDLDSDEDEDFELPSDPPVNPTSAFKSTSGDDNTRNKFSPYPSDKYYYCDLLLSMPRHHISKRMAKIIWWWAKKCGADIPSLSSVRRCQKKLRTERNIGTNPVRHVSPLGKVFYVNDIRKIIQQELSNPQIHITSLPDETDDIIRNLWQGKKWKEELPAELICPMVFHDGQGFFVDEPIRLSQSALFVDREGVSHSTCFFVAKRFFTKGDGTFARGHFVLENKDQETNTVTFEGYEDLEHCTVVPVSQFDVNVVNWLRNYPESESAGGCVALYPSNSSSPKTSPLLHPLREKVGTRKVVPVPLLLFGDDTSAGRGSKWAERNNVYFQLAGIVSKLLMQEYNIHFLATSGYCEDYEIMCGVVEQLIKAFDEGGIAFNPESMTEVFFLPFVIILIGDNPFHATMASAGGPQYVKLCRACPAGCSKKDEDTAEGIKSRMLIVEPLRTAVEVASIAVARMRDVAAGRATASSIAKDVTATGVKDHLNEKFLLKMFQDYQDPVDLNNVHSLMREVLEEARKSREESREIVLEDLTFNPMFRLLRFMFDVTQDTPVEPLHTIFLGFVKYLWRHIVNVISQRVEPSRRATIKQELAARLNSLNTDGTTFARLLGSTLVDYANSLVGRDFRALLQLAIFALEPFLTSQEKEMWITLRHLASLIFYREVGNCEAYEESLKIALDSFLTATVLENAAWLHKGKYHIALHLRRDARRFPPLFVCSSERYESYNSLFRGESVNSPHHTPSRELAGRFAEINRVRHIASGGYWTEDGIHWKHPGPGIQRIWNEDEMVREIFGLHNTNEDLVPGKLGKRLPPSRQMKENFDLFDSITCLQGEKCKIGSYVLLDLEFSFEDSETKTRVAKIQEIARSAETRDVQVTLKPFKQTAEEHPYFREPTFTDALQTVTVESKEILLLLNVQHDCSKHQCPLDTFTTVYQEGEATELKFPALRHLHEEDVILNTSILRNPHILQQYFPLPLKTPPPVDEIMPEILERREEIKTTEAVAAAEKAKAAAKRSAQKASRKVGSQPQANVGLHHEEIQLGGGRKSKSTSGRHSVRCSRCIKFSDPRAAGHSRANKNCPTRGMDSNLDNGGMDETRRIATTSSNISS